MAEEYGRLPEEEILGQIPGLMEGMLRKEELGMESVGKGCQCIFPFEKHYIDLAIEALIKDTEADKERWAKALEEEMKKPEGARSALLESMKNGGQVYDMLIGDLKVVRSRFQVMPSC